MRLLVAAPLPGIGPEIDHLAVALGVRDQPFTVVFFDLADASEQVLHDAGPGGRCPERPGAEAEAGASRGVEAQALQALRGRGQVHASRGQALCQRQQPPVGEAIQRPQLRGRQPERASHLELPGGCREPPAFVPHEHHRPGGEIPPSEELQRLVRRAVDAAEPPALRDLPAQELSEHVLAQPAPAPGRPGPLDRRGPGKPEPPGPFVVRIFRGLQATRGPGLVVAQVREPEPGVPGEQQPGATIDRGERRRVREALAGVPLGLLREQGPELHEGARRDPHPLHGRGRQAERGAAHQHGKERLHPAEIPRGTARKKHRRARGLVLQGSPQREARGEDPRGQRAREAAAIQRQGRVRDHRRLDLQAGEEIARKTQGRPGVRQAGWHGAPSRAGGGKGGAAGAES